VRAARAPGIAETSEGLLADGLEQGLILSGWTIGPALLRALESAEPVCAPGQSDIAHSLVGGPGLWLRAEPGEDADQAHRLAALIGQSLKEKGA
jgi:hypothetical protein